mmetsp:Transcript_12991/g.36597  ORF Transcript_12991/g.36597 Transcript_12991/m.36597 type:complete len:109 (-) Transcript_12991:85-411(-)|eukprot:CAMPEP_0172375852 /NCGR_PEP_ID=MMETSP1060-20121228/63713_1 /TAXON_ID=37318 /ORGANISM="Pseudo-nitzschia pungens, Strain cf. cingulata" /LENGTH=108 /DNA_ID=CAMNT_0013103139 /DNA_START=171 /DNA_END=497 /DNA_ORIENTATION=+
MVEEDQDGSPLEVGDQGSDLRIHYDDIRGEEALDVRACSGDDHSARCAHHNAIALGEEGEASGDSGVDVEPCNDDHEDPLGFHYSLSIGGVHGEDGMDQVEVLLILHA